MIKIGEIRAALKSLPDGQLQDFIETYRADGRMGVQALVTQAEKTPEKNTGRRSPARSS